ncbi:MerR family transcriptional regulator [Alkaliphilus crotonatoxidans]
MEYTIQKLATMAGVSTRTLRYYDQLGILKPARINSSGYRIYGQAEVNRLQQILFYRELDVSLEQIKAIITSDDFDSVAALREHRKKLLAKRNQLDMLIKNVDKTIAQEERRIPMTDQEKFEGFKKSMVEENEEKYGKEIREKYGKDVVEASNKKFLQMSQEQYAKFEALGEKILDTLEAAFATGDPAGALAQEAADLHRQWLTFTWNQYSKEAHANLGQMYVDDERFTAYYDKRQPGLAKFLRDAILIYTDK